MSALKTVAALAVGVFSTLSVASFGQNGQDQGVSGNGAASLVLDELATIDWIEKSDVAALREGVIDKMELKIGMPVLDKGLIGTLHKEAAELTVAKSQVLVDSTGAIEKGKAQKKVAASVVARNERLNARKPGMVSAEDMAKAEGELEVSAAMTKEAEEQREVNRAELNLAQRILEEHTIRAPFPGVIVKRYKNPGESVRANEAVVSLGNLSKLCANAYVPLEFTYRVKEGQDVMIQPKITTSRGEPLPIERKQFRGKITFVDPQIQAIAETAVRIRAEFDNPNFELRPGLKVQMTIYLNQDVASRVPPPATR
jgi:RND family efflux transporter MFP subunit